MYLAQTALPHSAKWPLVVTTPWLAIKTMNTLDPRNGDLIRIGREHKVSDWLVKGYFGFATQDDPLSLTDVKDVIRGLEIDEGLDQIVKLAGLREKNRGEKPSSYNDLGEEGWGAKPTLGDPLSTIKPTVGMKGKAAKPPMPSPPRCSTPPPFEVVSGVGSGFGFGAPRAKGIGGLDMDSIRTMFKSEVDEVVMFEKYLRTEI